MHDPGSHEGRFELGIEVQRALSTRMYREESITRESQAEGQDKVRIEAEAGAEAAEPYLFDGNRLSVRRMNFLNAHSFYPTRIWYG